MFRWNFQRISFCSLPPVSAFGSAELSRAPSSIQQGGSHSASRQPQHDSNATPRLFFSGISVEPSAAAAAWPDPTWGAAAGVPRPQPVPHHHLAPAVGAEPPSRAHPAQSSPPSLPGPPSLPSLPGPPSRARPARPGGGPAPAPQPRRAHRPPLGPPRRAG